MSAERDMNDPAEDGEGTPKGERGRDLREELKRIDELLRSRPASSAAEQDAAELLDRLLRRASEPVQRRESKRRVTELRGLGKSIWQGVDAQDYVDAERETWNG